MSSSSSSDYSSGEQENGEFTVEEILDDIKKDDGEILYLIKWKNYGDESNTWEPTESLDNCPEKLKKYLEEKKEKEKLTKSKLKSKKIPHIQLGKLANLYDSIKKEQIGHPVKEEPPVVSEHDHKMSLLEAELQNLIAVRPNIVYACKEVDNEKVYYVSAQTINGETNFPVSSTALKLYKPELIINYLENKIRYE
ncbi:hypothetical protein TVAG_340790 [Trichomonas vaginalis G3]|uniref:Chromo domain-containing protein n=1 Tax=Trichomonas vaginalis (strain ATCC PRA-98 / G3) TaxID=412133 RepID=A2DTN8_TRIV3|nr:chromo shadow domain-containing protein [Trichomonas vaginalis G3]EAY16185.1 hypothetical protein TVAG_340790 [Trichomonas vaginalis G3]KAI5493322.1 chromo shadow domain-containing protein [Trichomonas vaginalis G3]|eukprot:XP_001328408.1 hypothetical protein [Trichomonas vaginalis G3]